MNIANVQTESRALVDADTTSYPAALMLIRNNTAMEEIAGWILDADGRWQWDDNNNVDYPNGVAGLGTLVSAQQGYSITAIDAAIIKILGVSVKDKAGIWHKLDPFDPDDLGGSSSARGITGPLFGYGPYFDKAEFFKTPGLPVLYDLTGNSVVLYPAPDAGISVTLASGLKVYAQRTAQVFTSAEVTTGTKLPGFASPWHSLVSYMSALPYAMSYKKDRVQFLMAEIARKKKELIAFYAKRDKDERTIMTPKRIRYV